MKIYWFPDVQQTNITKLIVIFVTFLWIVHARLITHINARNPIMKEIYSLLLCEKFKASIKYFFFTEKLDAARAFMIIGILQYGAAFLLLALAQFLKIDIFQKIVALTFWSICKSKFIYIFLIFDFYLKIPQQFLVSISGVTNTSIPKATFLKTR